MKKTTLKSIEYNFAFFIASLLTVNLTLHYFTLYDLKDNYGFYMIHLKTIGIKMQDVKLLEVRHIVNHEMGHYLYHECIPKEWKAKYSNVYSTTQCKWNEDESEDFAESYSYYLTDLLNDLGKNEFCLEKFRYFVELSTIKIEC